MGWYQEGYKYWLLVLRTIFLKVAHKLRRLIWTLKWTTQRFSVLVVTGSIPGVHSTNKSQKCQFGTTHLTRGVDFKYSLINITTSRMCKFVRFRLWKCQQSLKHKKTDQNFFFGIEIDSFNFDCHSLVHCVL